MNNAMNGPEIEVNHGDDLEMIHGRWSVPEGSDGTGIYNVLDGVVSPSAQASQPLQYLNLRQYQSGEIVSLY